MAIDSRRHGEDHESSLWWKTLDDSRAPTMTSPPWTPDPPICQAERWSDDCSSDVKPIEWTGNEKGTKASDDTPCDRMRGHPPRKPVQQSTAFRSLDSPTSRRSAPSTPMSVNSPRACSPPSEKEPATAPLVGLHGDVPLGIGHLGGAGDRGVVEQRGTVQLVGLRMTRLASS